MLQKYLKEKNEYLNKAYEAAINHAPSSPLSVQLNPIAFGRHIGFDEDTTKRIVNELVVEGLATSGLGMKILLITSQGLNYLQALSSNSSENQPSINIKVGNNSNLQLQNASINSTQSIENNMLDKEYLEKMVLEIRKELKELAKYLTEAQVEELIAETNYLENNLKREIPKITILKTVSNNIGDILKAIPANILANILTSYVQNQF
jgi:hypothetical protein